jgi:hypothetical protein
MVATQVMMTQLWMRIQLLGLVCFLLIVPNFAQDHGVKTNFSSHNGNIKDETTDITTIHVQ